MRINMTCIAALVLVAASTSLSFGGPGANDTQLYTNGNILTMNAARPIARAMSVRSGRILAIGDLKTAKRGIGNDYDVYDLEGKTVVPGFIETHEHIVNHGGVMAWADLTPATTRNRDEAIAKLRRHKPDDNGWILGFGAEPLLYENEDGRPTWRRSLDEVSTQVPVFVLHNSGHAAFANTKAFEVAGITTETEAPLGGEFVKDASGELEGYINGRPSWMMIRGFPSISLESTRRAAEARAERGITTASELAIMAPYMLRHLQQVTSEPGFPIRIVGGLAITMAGLDKVVPQARSYETDLFKVRFIKAWADGSIQSGTAALSEGYYDFDRAVASGLTTDQEGFNAQVLRIYKLGFWPALHTNGDAALDLALTAIENARRKTGKMNVRPQLIHCQYVRPVQFDRVRGVGATMTFFVTHVYNYGDLHRDVFLGPERAARISPIKVAIGRGIPSAMHDDAPVAMPNPMFNIWIAVNRTTRSGKSLGPDLRITAAQAIAAYTRDAAYQLGLENQVGTLERGKYADFVVLEENPLTVDPSRIKDIGVLATVMNGRVTLLSQPFKPGGTAR